MLNRRQLQTFVLVAVMMGAAAGFVTAQSGTGPVVKMGSQQLSDDGAASPMPSSEPPLCPEAGIPAPHKSSARSNHKVTLTWKTSVPGKPGGSEPVGYCLYRSKKQGLAKMAMAIPNAHCGGCEQVNRIPIAGTGCVDELVEDNATYYYVVTAIASSGLTSSSSDETIAIVPRHKHAGAVPPTYPSCRGLSLAK